MSIHRRTFLKSAASVIPAAAFQNVHAQSSPETLSAPTLPDPTLHPVPAGADRSGHPHSLGFSSLAFKVIPSDTAGNLLVIEHTNLMPNTGPALHLHFSQEEWFYIMEGEVRFQVGDRRIQLGPGESILAPRRIPHTFSAAGSPAQMLIAFTPADKMEQYFIDAAAHPELAPTRDFMNRYDMQWIGPSPFWKS
jgi:mannose-6-phosphate isomerase-like protein (cupin superfamily)